MDTVFGFSLVFIFWGFISYLLGLVRGRISMVASFQLDKC
jgi:hypothetical protein